MFSNLYKQHGVELIGVWKNEANPLEYYMITKYRDLDHYNQFLNEVKENPEYVAMTRRINEVRISSESINLIPED